MKLDLSFLNNFKEMFKKPANSAVGVDIGTSSIKVTQLKKERGKIVLETYGEISLGPYNDKSPKGSLVDLKSDILNEPLAHIFEEARVTSPHGVLAIPSQESLIFMLKLPQLNEKDLAEVVHNEARRHIPVPLADVQLDWWLIPDADLYKEEPNKDKKKKGADNKDGEAKGKTGGSLHILVAAVRNDFLTAHSKLLTDSKVISNSTLELDIFSAMRSSLKHELAPAIILDFGASGVRFVIVEYGIMKKFHSINRGSYHLSDALADGMKIPFEEAESMKKEIGLVAGGGQEKADIVASTLESNLGFFFNELRNFLLNFERIEQKSIRKIILIGGGSELPGLLEAIAKKVNIETIYANPFARTKVPDFMDDILDDAGPEFAISIGLAMKLLES